MKKLSQELQSFLSQRINALDDIDYAQLCDKSEKIKEEFRKLIADFIEGEYKDQTEEIKVSEEDEEDRTPRYPPRYHIKPITDQIEILAEIAQTSPKLAQAYVRNTLPNLTVPREAEGWFAILSRRYESEKSYFQRVQLLKKRMSQYRDIDPDTSAVIDKLFITKRTELALTKIEKEQKGTILIIPAQFGIRHTGMTGRRAQELFTSNEFGLDLLSLISMHITHPTRLPTAYHEHAPEFTTHCCGNYFNISITDYETTHATLEIMNQTLETSDDDECYAEDSHPTGFLIGKNIYD